RTGLPSIHFFRTSLMAIGISSSGGGCCGLDVNSTQPSQIVETSTRPLPAPPLPPASNRDDMTSSPSGLPAAFADSDGLLARKGPGRPPRHRKRRRRLLNGDSLACPARAGVPGSHRRSSSWAACPPLPSALPHSHRRPSSPRRGGRESNQRDG